ncbi:hypothetical protein BC749_105236 [Flavobacterium araucananum]|uniref:Fn3-like domain-containing protein n=1 Tax=Flavobacterium araucananum TaxID=946678 RepID=A0A227NS51_9FLAO|nr:hypothetical protein [Flavobacterium araucananum]OXG00537.1 hypothetical protein B0A64_20130 [Flavobacterium araucananum]PWJ98398.1 hypothetical protein BC749_105236 [Flavobacterium araucananum]
MITKTTLEKALKFVNNCKFIFSFKKNIFKKNVFVLLFILLSSISFAQSGSCNATLIVENNGNIRSTPPDGTYYAMVLTNNSSLTDTFVLSAKNINATCANTDGSSTAGNVMINTDFIDSERNSLSEITLNAGQSVNFYIHITIPTGTSIQKWSCNEITATSKNCTNYAIATVLHTYVINPVND